MQSIALLSEVHKELIVRMKRGRKPSRRLTMPIVLLAADGYSPSEDLRGAQLLYGPLPLGERGAQER